MVRKKKNEEANPGDAMLRQLEETSSAKVTKPVAKKEPKPKSTTPRTNDRNTVLSPLTKLRTLYWFRNVQAIAGCSPSQMNKYVITGLDREYPLYAEGVREPSQKTLEAVEKAVLLGKDVENPFKGTHARFKDGPEGSELWSVLDGDMLNCTQVLKDLFAGEFIDEHLANSTWERKIAYFKSVFFLPEQMAFVEERMTHTNGVKFMTYSFYTSMVLDMEDLNHPALNNFRAGMAYDMEQLVGLLAMRVVAYELQMNVQAIDFMALGVMRILIEAVPEIGGELKDFFKDDFNKRNRKLFPQDTNYFKDWWK